MYWNDDREAHWEIMTRQREKEKEKQKIEDLPGLTCGQDCSTCIGQDENALVDDMVLYPPHYTRGKIEVLDFILDQDFGYLDGQVIKYLCRYRWKGEPVRDLKKGLFYLERLIRQHERKE